MTAVGGRARPAHARLLLLSVGSLLAALSMPLLAAPRAFADADPASDVLLTQSAFFPYAPTVPESVEVSLETTLEGAAEKGLPLRVAIIDSPEDLGAVPGFFGHPQAYATFLDKEISYPPPAPPVPLLVLMPAGFGSSGVPPPNSLARVQVDRHHGTYGLVNTAIDAVHQLLRERGQSSTTPSVPERKRAASEHRAFRRPTGPGPLPFVLPLALLAVGGVVGYVRRRRGRKA